MIKKCILGILCLTVLLAVPTICLAADHPQMKDLKGHWSEAQVKKAVDTGWVNGYPDQTFRPENTITRAEFTKMALAADRLIPGNENAIMYENDRHLFKSEKIVRQPLTDVDRHWLTTQGWTKIALNYGMIVSDDYAHSGYKFHPDKPITRYEMAIIMDRMLGLVNPANMNHKDESTGFKDDENMKDWQKGYVIEAQNAGVLQGYPDGSFHGERTATRAEAVTMVQNALDYMEEGIDEDIVVRISIDGQHWVESDSENGTMINGKRMIYTSYHWDREVPNAVAQIIDGKIYVPLVRCYAVDQAMNRVLKKDFAEDARVQWEPINQVLMAERGMSMFAYQSGISGPGDGEFYKEYLQNQGGWWYNGIALKNPPRMLYGQMMVGLELVEDSEQVKSDRFPYSEAALWDPATKTVIIDMSDPIYPNS